MTNNLKEDIRKTLLLGLANHTDEFLNPVFIPGMSHEELAEVLDRIMNSRLIERIETLINQKEKELLEKVEELLDDRFVGCTGYMPNIDESGNQLYGCLYCGEARSSTVHTISEVRLGIKQLKEELKGGEG